MESFSAWTEALTIGSMADFLAGDSDRLVIAYWKSSPTAPAAAMALTPPSAKAISPAIARVEGSLNARSLPASAAAGRLS